MRVILVMAATLLILAFRWPLKTFGLRTWRIKNVARIIDIGSPKLPLQEEARRIFHICVSHGISIEPEWVPRASNEQADYLSRIVDPDDWSVSLPIFQLLNSRWGPTLLIVLLMNTTVYCPDLIPGFGILFVKPWTLLQDLGSLRTTGFVRRLIWFRELSGT